MIPPGRISRPHILRRLQEGWRAGCTLTLFSAPAGFGKTTCAGEWLKEQKAPAAWLTLEPADDDPGRFFLYLIAVVCGIMSLVLLLTARPVVEVVSLADRYNTAATDAERNMLLAAGEPLLALFTGTAYYVSYFLGSLSLLISAILMLRGTIFSKATAWVGIVTNLVAFGLFIPSVGIFLAFLSLAGLVAWDIQLARRFFLLARIAAESSPMA
jgi:hypothetical protein